MDINTPKKITGSSPLEEHVKRGLIVGKDFFMNVGCFIDYSHTWHIKIGDYVTLGPNVHILAHDTSTKMHLGYTRIGKIKIGDRVFVGAGSIILPGVTIGNNVVIGAGSIVSKNIPDNQAAAGNPAQVICTIDEYLEKKKKEMEGAPCFGAEYTIRKNLTDEMKKEMNKKMKNGIGYIL